MNSKSILKLDWASYGASRYAVEHWHYSESMPAGKMVKIGVWENCKYIGCILYGRGATPEIGKPFNLDQTEICELTRIALTTHINPVSRMISISLKMLKKLCPGIKLIVSYSDTAQGHHGGIYQAGGWIYVGSIKKHAYIVCGKVYHPKTLYGKYGIGGQSVPWLKKHVDPNAKMVRTKIKHKYLMPLNNYILKSLKDLSLPYPKRAPEALSSDASASSGEKGVRIPPRRSRENKDGMATRKTIPSREKRNSAPVEV